jgi:hypothetical protein
MDLLQVVCYINQERETMRRRYDPKEVTFMYDVTFEDKNRNTYYTFTELLENFGHKVITQIILLSHITTQMDAISTYGPAVVETISISRLVADMQNGQLTYHENATHRLG